MERRKYNAYIKWILHRLHMLFIVADHCNGPPAISFEDYLDTVYAQTNSARPGWYNSLDESEKRPGTETHNLYLYRNGTRCNHRRHHRHHNDISSLASCPFTFVDHIDENRFPRRLLHALCLCNHPRVSPDNSNNYICKSVVQYVSVFYKHGCTYIRYWEPVPVACIAIAISRLEATFSSSTRIVPGE
ncbi:uncharacterized protein LOC123533076 isoform X2 [Mercenaria mercenaria]|uniref:uncharacterized protein LOC123533076 isoform X2 n=1 Tax=Mercenaria mercenaria TaxID=6596 RepID=UPI001E1E1EEB|nr:uncharacterized protein LOC123533076 isoform X2 [Mercenaria mercenaria]